MQDMKSLILFLLLLAFSFTSCKKNKTPDPTPPEIQGNYISFKLNGQLWESGDLRGGVFYLDVNDFRYLYLYCNKNYETFHLYLNRPFVTSTKLLNEWTMEHYYVMYPKNYGAFNRYNSGVSNDTWMTNAEDTGHCTITYIDTVKQIIKGTFSFKAQNQRTGEVITISDGYFQKVII
jgi:hypothetical protein